MDLDIDPNIGGDEFILQMADDRFFIVVWVAKSRLTQTRRAISSLLPGSEVVLGTIRSGERVWVSRDESGYCLAVGDADCKDICYKITEGAVAALLNAEAA